MHMLLVLCPRIPQVRARMQALAAADAAVDAEQRTYLVSKRLPWKPPVCHNEGSVCTIMLRGALL